MTWREAIEQVLRDAAKPLGHHDIAERILEKNLRTTTGRTPANTVHRELGKMIREKHTVDGEVILKTPNGYARTSVARAFTEEEEEEDPNKPTFINAYGLNWERGSVSWRQALGNLLGYQGRNRPQHADCVDFAGQDGIYLLHHGSEIVYAGQTQATDNTGLYRRLRHHNEDPRKRGRWNTFSWFGCRPVNEDTGRLEEAPESFPTGDVITLIETILIESLLPRLNMRSGDLIKQARESRLYFQWQG